MTEVTPDLHPSAIDALLRPLFPDVAVAAVHARPTLAQIDACLGGGGHYWDNPPVGVSSTCTGCGHRGALNVPAVNECGMGIPRH